MTLNIFSNCTNDILAEQTIHRTYKSYTDTFGEPTSLAIYVDPNPNPQHLDSYLDSIRKAFNIEPIVTTGLADGFVQSINNAADEYIFQLEHDWLFQNIEHSLDDIMKLVVDNDLFYMRFNQHPNRHYHWLRHWQTDLKPREGYCLTDNLSNNPHILNVEYYQQHLLDRIDPTVKGAGLIEEVLTKKGYWGAVYGSYDHPATIIHIDGRKNGSK